MTLRLIRSLVRECLLQENTVQTQKSSATPIVPQAPEARTGVRSTYGIKSYHKSKLAFTEAAAISNASSAAIRAAGGCVFVTVGGKVIKENSGLKPGGALDQAGGIDVIRKACEKLDVFIRSVVKASHPVNLNAVEWKSSVLKNFVDDQGRPYLTNDRQVQDFMDYINLELDAVPLMFMIADPTTPEASRRSLNKNLSGATYAWYDINLGAYCVNLLDSAGWSTVIPKVSVAGVRQATGTELRKIVTQLRAFFSNPSVEPNTPKHEFGHARDSVFDYYIRQVLLNRKAKGFSGQVAKVNGEYVDHQFATIGKMNQSDVTGAIEKSRLTTFASVVKSRASNLIAAKTPQEVFNAVTQLGLKPNVSWLEYAIQYSWILRNLGLISSDGVGIGVYSADTQNNSSSVQTLAKYTPTDINLESVKQFVFDAADSTSTYHIVTTLSMIKQYVTSRKVDVATAVEIMRKENTTGDDEDSRRADVLISLTGADGMKKVIDSFVT